MIRRFLLLVLFPSLLLARPGVVETRSGETIEGRLALINGQVLIVSTQLNLVRLIAVTNLQSVVLETNGVASPPDFAEVTTSSSLSAPWQEADIGRVQIPGSTRQVHNVFTARSSGVNIDGEADRFHFVYKEVSGPSEIVARVETVQYTDPGAKAGVMMRETLEPGARLVFMGLTALRGGAFQHRDQPAGTTEVVRQAEMFPPFWVRLRREGDEFVAYKSKHGRNWTLVERVSLPMATNFFVGLATAGVKESVLNWTTFEKVREAPSLANDEEFPPRVELAGGSVLRARVMAMDDKEVTLRMDRGVTTVSTRDVARVIFQWLPWETTLKLMGSRPGVLMSNGDFIDAEVRGVREGKVEVSSLLFGTRRLNVGSDVVALVLRRNETVTPRFVVTAANGTRWFATEMSFQENEVRLEETTLGKVAVPIHQVREIRRR